MKRALLIIAAVLLLTAGMVGQTKPDITLIVVKTPVSEKYLKHHCFRCSADVQDDIAKYLESKGRVIGVASDSTNTLTVKVDYVIVGTILGGMVPKLKVTMTEQDSKGGVLWTSQATTMQDAYRILDEKLR